MPLKLSVEPDDRDLPNTTSNCAIANKLKDLGYYRPFVDKPRGDHAGVISFGVPAERLRYYFYVREDVAEWLDRFDAWNKGKEPAPGVLHFTLREKDLKGAPQPMGDANLMPRNSVAAKPRGTGKTASGIASERRRSSMR